MAFIYYKLSNNNIQYMIKIVLLSLAFILVVSQEVLEFEIYKSYADDQHDLQKVNLGTLEVRRNLQYSQVEASIRPNYPVLVSSNDLLKSLVVLQFVPKKVQDLEHDNKVYKTAVIERLIGSHDQVIGVVVGIDLKIKSIGYFEKRSPLQEIRAEVIKMEAGKQEITKIEMAAKKPGVDGAPQQQSFFSKYKWPIIIGIALVYLLSAADGKQGEQGAPNQR